MCCAVDAQCQTRDHGESGFKKLTGELPRVGFTLSGGVATAHHRNGVSAEAGAGPCCLPQQVEHQGRFFSEPVEGFGQQGSELRRFDQYSCCLCG